MQPAVGIDLGTTYSAVAYLDAHGRPVTLINGAGDLLSPSAVSFEDGQVVVGKEAVKASVFEPAQFADCFKRDMGRRHFRRTIGSQAVPPEVLSGFILERLKLDAEARIGTIERAVITVPAFFDETRRRATQEAGRLAGLEVLDIINEPTAAAIAFAYYRRLLPQLSNAPPNEKILVYDLGGGTFDVTVLDIQGDKLLTLATDGDVQLGGKDFDERLVNHVADAFLTAHGVDPRSNPHDAAQLWLQVQDAKHTLSERDKTAIPCAHAGIRMRIDVTRDLFQALTRDLLERTENTTQLVLKQARLDWQDIDRVLLVGGSTRMPMVREMLRRLSGKNPDSSLSPDEAVAHGAAIYAGLLTGAADRQATSTLEIVNVNSHSLGIIGLDRRTNRRQNTIVIPKNTPLPCKVARKFVTARSNQSSVKIAIVEGESEQPEHCIALGECVVRNLPPGLPQDTTVEVEYRYETSGRISVVARVPSVRQSASVEIQHAVGHDLGTLDAWRQKLSDQTVSADETDQSALVDRLDRQLERFGRELLPLTLSEPCRAAQLAAKKAILARDVAKGKFEHAETNRLKAVGPTETMAATSQAARSKAELDQAETASRFALIALARDVFSAKCYPERLELMASEIDQLQRMIGTTL